ncbi:MAG: GAF domain-containing protein [Elusimicrobia bacterium]|nr:GAF domain-containing protein [Elusimicrobiota bacterium]
MAQSQSETLELLLEMGQLLSSKLDINELLVTILKLASRVVRAEQASLLLLDEKTQELYFDVALGLGEEASKLRLKMGQGIAGAVAKTKKSEIINDPKSDPRWSPKMDEQSGFTTKSILAVPMNIKGKLLGVVEAINKIEGSFGEDDARLFEAFASQAAVAIENARLFSSLKEEKSKLGTVFTEMADGAVLCDGELKVLLANGAARKLLALGAEPTTLGDCLKSMSVSPPLADILKSSRSANNFTATRAEPKELILAGTIVNLVVSDPLAHDAKAAAQSGWLCVFRDETEERKKENLKRTFLSLISHKLKTPLSAVIGYSDILLEEFKEAPPPGIQLKAAETISVQGRKLGDLVDRLLRYTTLETPDHTIELAPTGIDQLVASAIKELSAWLADKNAVVDYKGAPGVIVVVDKGQMREVIKNLIENGVKFDTKPQKKVEVWVETPDKKAIVRVKDTGPGIPPEDQEKIFSAFHQIETFFTGQVDGWGLGLPYIKKVVESHGGTIALASKLGEGSVFSVTLPRKAT